MRWRLVCPYDVGHLTCTSAQNDLAESRGCELLSLIGAVKTYHTTVVALFDGLQLAEVYLNAFYHSNFLSTLFTSEK